MSFLGWAVDLPENWEAKSLRSIAHYVVSSVDKVTHVGEIPVRLCNYVDVYHRDFISLDLDFMHATASEAEIEKFGLRVDDVLITKDSESWDDIGVPALVRQTSEDLVCGYHLALIRVFSHMMTGAFLFRCLQAKPIQVQLELAANGVTRFGIPKSGIGMLKLPVPPLPRQRAIAEYLDRETARLDALMAAKERILALLTEKRRAIITSAISRGLNPKIPLLDSGVAWLGKIPAHWKIKRLKHVGKPIIGLAFNPKNAVPEGSGVLVLRASNIKNQRIILENKLFVKMEIPKKLITRIGDILICSRSGSQALIGKNAVIDSFSAGFTFGVFMTVFRSPYNGFLFYVFNSPIFDYQAGAFSTSTINQLTIEALKNLRVPIPPSNEQEAIVAHIEAETQKFDKLIQQTNQSIILLKERKTALIAAAVTGQFDIGEAA